ARLLAQEVLAEFRQEPRSVQLDQGVLLLRVMDRLPLGIQPDVVDQHGVAWRRIALDRDPIGGPLAQVFQGLVDLVVPNGRFARRYVQTEVIPWSYGRPDVHLSFVREGLPFVEPDLVDGRVGNRL